MRSTLQSHGLFALALGVIVSVIFVLIYFLVLVFIFVNTGYRVDFRRIYKFLFI